MAVVKLSNFMRGLSGRAGNAVYRFTKNGTELADRPIVNNPDTPSQSAVRTAFTRVTQQWKSLTPAQAEAWNTYAEGIRDMNDVSGSIRQRSGFNWFVAFGTRYLLVNSDENQAPATPPQASFPGDALTFTVTAQTGAIKFVASAPNGAFTTTALLVQRLRNANAKPSKQYRTLKHFAFASGSLETTVPVTPGHYAVAIQYVNLLTGQETEMNTLGKVGPVSFAVAEGSSKSKKAA